MPYFRPGAVGPLLVPVFLVILGTPALPVQGAPSWRSIPTPPESEPFHSLAAHGDTLWAGLESGVRTSMDGGKTWSDPGTGMNPGKVVGLVHIGGRLVACQSNLVYVSEDGGRSWTSRDTTIGMPFLRLVARNDTLFAVFSLFSNATEDGYHFSADSGSNWSGTEFATTPEPSSRVFGGKLFFHTRNGTVLYRDSSGNPVPHFSVPDGIAQVEATDRNLFVLTPTGLCMASGMGESPWKFVEAGSRTPRILAVAADSARIAIQTDRGLSFSPDGGRDWKFLRRSPYPSRTQRLAMSNRTLYAWSGGIPSLHRYDLTTEVWDSTAFPRNFTYSALAAKGDWVVYAGTNSIAGVDTTFVSENRGTQFGPPNRAFSTAPSAPAVVMVWGSAGLFALDWMTTAASDDSGRTWNRIMGSCSNRLIEKVVSMAPVDSEVYYLDARGAIISALDCPDSLDLPSGAAKGRSLAGSGGRLYLGTDVGLWVREEAPILSIANRPFRRNQDRAPSFPVRTWKGPGSSGAPGRWFDARGVIRSFPENTQR